MTEQDESKNVESASNGGVDAPVGSSQTGNRGHDGLVPGVGSVPATNRRDAREEFLLEAVRRAPILDVLRSGPATASELTEATERSRSTIHRAVDSLRDYNLISKRTGRYELTTLGGIIATETGRFSTRAWSAATLEPFLNEIESLEIPVEYFEDAVITRRQPRQPHITIQRLIELIENSAHMRMLSTVLSPIHVEVGYREMMEGMQIEAVFDAEAINIMLSKYQDKAVETVATGNFTVYVHDSLPFELFIFDDKMGMAAHDETGNAEVLVECGEPDAIEWAKDIYETHRAEAEPLLLPEKTPDE